MQWLILGYETKYITIIQYFVPTKFTLCHAMVILQQHYAFAKYSDTLNISVCRESELTYIMFACLHAVRPTSLNNIVVEFSYTIDYL